jgi:hypothetical protein
MPQPCCGKDFSSMALHNDLPIYKAVYELLDMAAECTKNIPRVYKRQFSDKVITECIEMTSSIMRANMTSNKTPHVDDVLERAQIVQLLFRLFVDKRWISIKVYSDAILLISNIGKQANGWKKRTLLPAS